MEYTYIHNHQSQFIEWFGNVTETTSLSSLIAESYPGEWGKEAKNNNGVKVLRTTNFQNNGHIDYSDVIVRYIEQKKIEKKCLRTGDIILERSGGTKDNPVGRVVLFEAEGEYMFNNFTQLLRPIKSVNPYYLFFYLHTSYNADKASMRAMASQTTGIQNLNMTDYMAKEIPLPSLEEQEQFERLYRQADKSKFDGFKSQFLEWFGSPVSNPKGWQVVPLKEASILVSDGPFGSNLKSCHYVNHGIRVIRLQNIGVGFFDDRDKAFISESHYNVLKKYTCKPGEVVIGTLGEPNLRACIVPDYIDTSINKADCIHVIPDETKLLPQFVCSYINCEETLYIATSQIHGTTRNRISGGQVSQLPIYLPQIELQKQFISVAEQADKSKYYEINET